MVLRILAIGSFLLFSGFSVWAQSNFEQGLALERAFKDHQALTIYEQILRTNPNDAEVLTHASRMLSNIGGRLGKESKSQKLVYLNNARSYAERAIALGSGNVNAHLALVISLGLQSEATSSASDKIKNAKLIYSGGRTMLQLDSNLAVGYFILGKWHFELGRLNWMERTACDLFFGGMPEGVSMAQALIYMQRASQLEPNTILFLYNEALIFQQLDNDKKALELVRYAMTLNNREPDDAIRKENCQRLLHELEH